MIIKRHLPFRYSREGCIPDRLFLQFSNETAEEAERRLKEEKKTVHFFLGKDGVITAFTPLTQAANELGPSAQTPEGDLSRARRGILIRIEGDRWSRARQEPLLRLIKRIQKEILRIYGESFPLTRETVTYPEGFPIEEILELGRWEGERKRLFRVQTGQYQTRRDAEESLERLAQAGIAGYITEVRV